MPPLYKHFVMDSSEESKEVLKGFLKAPQDTEKSEYKKKLEESGGVKTSQEYKSQGIRAKVNPVTHEGIIRACTNCGKTKNGMGFCIKCRAVYYCSRDCQTSHWKQHKKVCTKSPANVNKILEWVASVPGLMSSMTIASNHCHSAGHFLITMSVDAAENNDERAALTVGLTPTQSALEKLLEMNPTLPRYLFYNDNPEGYLRFILIVRKDGGQHSFRMRCRIIEN